MILLRKVMQYLYTILCIPSIFILNLFDSEKYEKKLKSSNFEWFVYILPHVLIFWSFIGLLTYYISR